MKIDLYEEHILQLNWMLMEDDELGEYWQQGSDEYEME